MEAVRRRCANWFHCGYLGGARSNPILETAFKASHSTWYPHPAGPPLLVWPNHNSKGFMGSCSPARASVCPHSHLFCSQSFLTQPGRSLRGRDYHAVSLVFPIWVPGKCWRTVRLESWQARQGPSLGCRLLRASILLLPGGHGVGREGREKNGSS